jgi:hypothetical protein
VTTVAGTAHLPALVRIYLSRSLPPTVQLPDAVRVHQTGEMWKKPGARAMPFRATEDFAVERISFSWRARFPIMGPFAMTVVDWFSDGTGQLRVSLLGIPLQTQTGPETSVGEAMRYLAELAWAPQAIAANRDLEWRDVDERTVEVGCDVGAVRATVRWEFNGAGDSSAQPAYALSRSGKRSNKGAGAAISADTRISTARECRRSARRGGSYQKVVSSTGVDGSRRSS